MAESPGGAGVAGGSGSHESGGGGDQSPASNVREQDRFLPIANIGRIMKKALPANGKIAKDAKDTVQECVSEFISFVTSEASDKCQKEKRKTINGDDLLWAMATLGFEDYVAPLKAYLARYRELEGDTKGSARGADGSAKKDTIGTQLVSDVEIFDSLLIKVPSHKALATQTPKLNIDQINGMWLAFCEAKCKGSKSFMLNSCHTYRLVDMFAVPEILYTLLHRRSIIV